MRLFNISVVLQHEGRKGDKSENFRGKFIVDENSHELKGYSTEMTTALSDVTRYIYGIYDEQINRLVFMKMSNESKEHVLLFAFHNTEKEGKWVHHNRAYDRFLFFGHGDGTATVMLEEITENTEVMSKEILNVYQKMIMGAPDTNLMLIERGVEPYFDSIIY